VNGILIGREHGNGSNEKKTNNLKKAPRKAYLVDSYSVKTTIPNNTKYLKPHNSECLIHAREN